MAFAFFQDAKVRGLLRSGGDASSPCEKAAEKDLAKFLNTAALSDEKLKGIELKAGNHTEREIVVASWELYYEIDKKLQKYRGHLMQRMPAGGSPPDFGIDANAVMQMFVKTAHYQGKEEVYQLLFEHLKERWEKKCPGFVGDYTTPKESRGVWARHPRAPLEQSKMASPASILCGLKALDVKQPTYLVRAGSLWQLAHGHGRGRRKHVVVQRIGDTYCFANNKYDGPLNLNSEGLQLERLLCDKPQYLTPNTPDFEEYRQQIFITKEVALDGEKSLCIYYPAFGKSDEKEFKGRVQVDSSGNPHNYRLRSGADIKDTVIQMWARNQRYLHHSEWDERHESISICVPVKEIQRRSGTGSQEQEEEEDELWQWKGEDAEDECDATDVEAFQNSCIRLDIRNGNKILSRPLPLKECVTFEELHEQAFQNEEANVAQNNIVRSLSRITRALGEKEQQHGTEDRWYSYAYYVDRDYLQGGAANTAEKVLSDKRVTMEDWLLPDGALPEYQRIVHPQYWEDLQAKKGKGRGQTVRGNAYGHQPQAHRAGQAKGSGQTKGRGKKS
mmetsp:Transcript_88164/g.175029  ORF Transcript_88164/g.175029 Transcript_88164/m.175029 type:complete len:559 (+) Transcript_88164:75-1751(+)|eukprot:CAMPEP_0172724098 /NCGR_PEP_ID=MMETSP1074-20121228/85141_1 /TAXON_ID=2916 /ORGANISM="Ceratium fusus, Strain PA161109" /LENGTH=558 /DNA_ID=CAMNT_0013550461 /DNA_START=75 /DNA_END=1751 /DNA_ORIENTATION=+